MVAALTSGGILEGVRVRSSIIALFMALALTLPIAPPGRADTLADDIARLESFRSREQWVQADSLATALLARLEGAAGVDSLALATVIFALGEARYEGILADDDLPLRYVTRSFEIRSRHLPENHPDIAISLAMMGVLLTGVDNDSALVCTRRALDIRLNQPAPDDSALGDSWLTLGELQIYRGDAGSAREPLETGIALHRRVFGADSPRLATPLSVLGEAWYALGDPERAIELTEQGLAILDRAGVRTGHERLNVLARLVKFHMVSGNLGRAFDAGHQAVQLAKASGDSMEIVISHNNLSVVLGAFGDEEGARRILTEVLPLCESTNYNLRSAATTIHQVLGAISLALGDTSAAMRYFTEAETGFMVPGTLEEDPTRALCVLGQASVLYAEHRYREALVVLRRGMEMNESSPQPELTSMVTARTHGIQYLGALGDSAGVDSARTDLAALRDRRSLADTGRGPIIAHWLAWADRYLGREAEAWAGALLADDGTRERLRYNVERLPDVRALELTRNRSYILNQVLDMADADRPLRWETAWDHLVRTRGMVRAELARRRLPRELAQDAEVALLHAAWVTAQRKLARRLVSGSTAPADSAARAALESVRSAVEQAEAAYVRSLRAHGADTTRVDVGLADVRAALPTGHALVGCAEIKGRDGNNSMVAWVARSGEPRIQRVELDTTSAIRDPIEAWRAALATSPGPGTTGGGAAEQECRRRGDLVRKLTWDRLAPSLQGATDVSIVPDGPLVDLPWHALPVGPNRYLVEDGPLVHQLDAERELVALIQAPHGSALVAIGDPEFMLTPHRPRAESPSNALRGILDPCAGGRPIEFTSLPATRAEATAVAATWRRGTGGEATVLIGPEATESAFKELAPGATILHLATHGVVVGDICRDAAAGARGVGGVAPVVGDAKPAPAPARTAPVDRDPSPWMGRRVWLAMAAAGHADEAASDDDGLLTAEEVVTLNLESVDWVVLSACHSGLAEAWGRDGTLGMRRSFQLAGARCVIASQWAVEDLATADWMRQLYDARTGGERRGAAAVQAVCRRILAERRTGGRTTHPFYWAAFTASGE